MTPELLITWTILLAALVGGWLAIRTVREWRKGAATPGPTPGEQLTQFQQLHERGDLSSAEWEQIRQALAHDERSDGAPPPSHTGE